MLESREGEARKPPWPQILHSHSQLPCPLDLQFTQPLSSFEPPQRSAQCSRGDRHRGRSAAAKRGCRALTPRLLVCLWEQGWEGSSRTPGGAWGVTLPTGPRPGPCSPRTWSWPQLRPVSQPVLSKDFLTPPPTEPSSGTSPALATPGHTRAWPPRQVTPFRLACPLLSSPPPQSGNSPARSVSTLTPATFPAPTPMPSFLALECGTEKASGHVS